MVAQKRKSPNLWQTFIWLSPSLYENQNVRPKTIHIFKDKSFFLSIPSPTVPKGQAKPTLWAAPPIMAPAPLGFGVDSWLGASYNHPIHEQTASNNSRFFFPLRA